MRGRLDLSDVTANPRRTLDSVQKERQRQAGLVLRMFAETQGLLKDYQEVQRKNVAYVGMVFSSLRHKTPGYMIYETAYGISVSSKP